MVLKGINRVHNDKIASNGLQRHQLGTQCKNQVKCNQSDLLTSIYLNISIFFSIFF